MLWPHALLVVYPRRDCQLPEGAPALLLVALVKLLIKAHLGQTLSDGTGLLWAEVEGEEGLLLVELSEGLALLRVDDGEDTGDRPPDTGAVDDSTCQHGRVRAPTRSGSRAVPVGRSSSGPSSNDRVLPLLPSGTATGFSCALGTMHAHLDQLGRVAAGDLCHAEVEQLLLELLELCLEVRLARADELVSAGLAFR